MLIDFLKPVAHYHKVIAYSSRDKRNRRFQLLCFQLSLLLRDETDFNTLGREAHCVIVFTPTRADFSGRKRKMFANLIQKRLHFI